MPVAEREGSRGQVLRGVCSRCQTITKGKTLVGEWLSRCAHPPTDYHGRMMQGGGKTVPVIPASVDVGILPGALVSEVDEDGGDPIRGMIGRDEREGYEEPVGWRPGPDVSVPSAGDPLSFDVRGSLESIAAHARGLAGALSGAQRRIRELEGLIATQAIEGANLRDRLEDVETENARLEVELQEDKPRLDWQATMVAADEIKRAEESEFDPDEILF